MKSTLQYLFVFVLLGQAAAYAQSAPTVLVDVDHRQSISLNGDWHFIVDPYAGGLYTFHRELRTDGYNRKGLISNNGEKKEAFFLLQKAYKERAIGKPE
jgi:hypothetical protein